MILLLMRELIHSFLCFGTLPTTYCKTIMEDNDVRKSKIGNNLCSFY